MTRIMSFAFLLAVAKSESVNLAVFTLALPGQPGF
jgi:hypothetical protein